MDGVDPACSLVIPVNTPDSAIAIGDRAEPVTAVIEIGVDELGVSVIVNDDPLGTVAM